MAKDTLLDTKLTKEDMFVYTRLAFAASMGFMALALYKTYLYDKGLAPKIPGKKWKDDKGNEWDVAVPDPEGVKQSPGVKSFAQWLYEYQQAHGHDPSEAEMAEQWGKGGI